MLVIIIKCCIFIICMLPVRTTLHSCLNTFAAFWRRSLGKLASLCTFPMPISILQLFLYSLAVARFTKLTSLVLLVHGLVFSISLLN